MPLPSHYNTNTNTKPTSSRPLSPKTIDGTAKKEHQTSNARPQLDDHPQLEVVLAAARPHERRTRDLGGQALPGQKGHGGAEVVAEVHCGLEFLSVGLLVAVGDGGG